LPLRRWRFLTDFSSGSKGYALKGSKTAYTEQDSTTLGIAALAIVFGFVFVIYFTLRAIKIWRAGDDDE